MTTQRQDLRKRKPERSSDSSLIYGKVPPQALELEKVVLGAIMLEKDAFDEVEILKPQMFYADAHQRVFESMERLSARHMPVDLLTVVQDLKENGNLELVGGPYFVTTLTSNVISAANIKTHAAYIHDAFLKRELIRVSSEIINQAYDEEIIGRDLLTIAEQSVGEIGVSNLNNDMVPVADVMHNVLEKIETFRKMDSDITGVPSGFPDLDKATRGWQPGDFIVLAARPSVGKTALALNIIREAAKNEIKPVTVAVWSLEMKTVFLGMRLLSSQSRVNLNSLQKGNLTEIEMSSVWKHANEISKLDIFMDEQANINIRTIARKARRLKKKKNLGLIVIDYLQLMEGEDKKGNREQEVSKISRGLKNLAQELDVPIIALSQLSRETGEKGVTWEYGPPLSAVRESGAIEQDADMVIMVWGPGDQDLKQDRSLFGKRKARIVKQRNGVLLTQELDFKNEIQLFEAAKVEYQSFGNFRPVTKEEMPDEDAPF